MTMTRNTQGIIAYILTTLFLGYEMALQVAPTVITKDLIHTLHYNAEQIGMMGSAYFYAYAFMQIPVGLLFDRFKLLPLLLSAIGLCVLGQGIFVYGQHSLYLLMAGRFLIGLGSAFAFVSVLIVANDYFPSRYFALLVGIAQLLAAVGAMSGTAPLAYAVAHYDWQNTLLALAIFGGLILLATFMFFPEKDAEQNTKPQIPPMESLKHLVKVPQVKWITLYAFANWAPITIFAALWGTPFLIEKFELTSVQASSLLALIWIGISFTSPFLGWLSDHIKNRRAPALYVGLIGLIGSSILIYTQHTETALAALCLFMIGMASSGQILTFAMMKDVVSEHHIGTAIGLNNMAVVFGGLLQAAVGYMIHAHWHAHHHNAQILHYSLGDYRHALWLIPVCFLVNVVVCMTSLKETHPQHKSAS